jgi:hypothetical protein
VRSHTESTSRLIIRVSGRPLLARGRKSRQCNDLDRYRGFKRRGRRVAAMPALLLATFLRNSLTLLSSEWTLASFTRSWG